jgi:hypothetical protein
VVWRRLKVGMWSWFGMFSGASLSCVTVSRLLIGERSTMEIPVVPPLVERQSSSARDLSARWPGKGGRTRGEATAARVPIPRRLPG